MNKTKEETVIAAGYLDIEQAGRVIERFNVMLDLAARDSLKIAALIREGKTEEAAAAAEKMGNGIPAGVALTLMSAFKTLSPEDQAEYEATISRAAGEPSVKPNAPAGTC